MLASGVGAITVRYFAAAADASGCAEEEFSFPEEVTVAQLRQLLEDRYGQPMQQVLRSGSFLLDGIVSRDPQQLLPTRVDILPPFAGG